MLQALRSRRLDGLQLLSSPFESDDLTNSIILSSASSEILFPRSVLKSKGRRRGRPPRLPFSRAAAACLGVELVDDWFDIGVLLSAIRFSLFVLRQSQSSV